MVSMEEELGPPIFDGTNYGYWKVRMTCFFRATDEKAWMTVVGGWTSPTAADGSLKPRTEWTSYEEKKFHSNKKALNLICAAVSLNVISLISNYDSAMEAWNFLNDIFGENSHGHEQRLSQITSKFEELKMDVNEIERSFEVLTQSAPSVPEYVPEDVLERENYDSLEVIEKNISTAEFGPITTQAREDLGAIEVRIKKLECMFDSSNFLSFKSDSSLDCSDSKSNHSNEEIIDANVLKPFRRMLKTYFISGGFVEKMKHERDGFENLSFFERINLEIAFVQTFTHDVIIWYFLDFLMKQSQIEVFIFHKFGMNKCKMRNIFMEICGKMTRSECGVYVKLTLPQNFCESLVFLYLYSRGMSFDWAVSDDLSVKALDGECLNALRSSLNLCSLGVM